MLKQYLKIACRIILRNKLSSIINIIGLSIGIGCCILIGFFLIHEFSYDRFNVDANRIYRFTHSYQNSFGYKSHFAPCSNPWIKNIPANFAEVETMVSMFPYKNITLKVKDENIILGNCFYIDSSFFKVFSIPLIKGNIDKALSGPNVVVISESFARKYYGNFDPVGKVITNIGWYDGKHTIKLNYTITGVFKDIPENSHFHSDIFISKTSMLGNFESEWRYVYLLFHKNAKPENFFRKFPSFVVKYDKNPNVLKEIVPYLQVITDIHLKSDKDREIENNSSMMVVYMMGITGFIILLISLVNYLNLSIAGLYQRSKSITFNKIHGGRNINIIIQSFVESFIYVSVSMVLAISFMSISTPFFNTVSGNIVNSQIIHLNRGLFGFILLIVFITLIVGCLPIIIYLIKDSDSVFLLKPDSIRKSYKPSSIFRKALIIFQFTLTIILIICTIVIHFQNRFIFKQQAGAKLDNVLTISIKNDDAIERYTVLKSELLASPWIKDVTSSMEEPFGQTMDAMGFETQGINDAYKDKFLWVYSADDNFFKFLDVPIIAGTDFPKFNKNFLGESYILNESAVKELGWTPNEAVGKPFKLKFSAVANIIFGGRIIGVVKDFNLNTLHQKIKPFVFFQKNVWFLNITVRIANSNKAQAISYIYKTWKSINPDIPLKFKYNSDIYFNAYKKEITQSRITSFFSLLAIILSCLGLFAISSIIILQRTKEIGLRKVNGANRLQIIYSLNAEFLILVTISILIACPIAMLIMNNWLSTFAYHISLSYWFFVIGSGIAIFIAILTVSWQSWQAASQNPIKALRYE